MEPITDILRKDHDRLRQLLDLLGHSLKKKGDGSRVACEVVLDCLEEELEAHLEREERYLLPYLYSVTGKGLKGYHEKRDHADLRATIQLLRDLWGESYSVSVGIIEAYASHLAETLREHMDEEETVVFPVAERALGEEMLETIADLAQVREGGGDDECTDDFEKRSCAHPLDPRTVGKRDLEGI